MRGLFVLLSLLFLQACSTPEQEAERVDPTLDSVLKRGHPVNLAEADALYEDGRYEAAATKYAAVLRNDGQNHLAAYRLGESLLNLNRPKESVGYFTAAKESPDLKARALQGIGLAFVQLGDPVIAQERLNQALDLDSTMWRAHNAMGQIHDMRSAWPEAKAAYGRALELNPGSAAIRNNLGMSYLLQRKFEPAIVEFQAALSLDPRLTQAKTNLRMALALNGDYADALAGVPQEQLGDALNNIGYAAMLRGDYDAAETYLTRAMEASPSYHRKAASNLARVQYLKQKTSG
jgi:Flp pilus assembly protein TadD